MTTDDREPISDEQLAAEVDDVVAEHDRPAEPVPVVLLDRRAVISGALALACFSILALVVIFVGVLVNIRQGQVINDQQATIGVERSRSVQVEAQLSNAQAQLTDFSNQSLCRAQIANDHEDVQSRYQALRDHRDQLFGESLTAILNGDRDLFTQLLTQVNDADKAIEQFEPTKEAAAAARRDSVATCAAKAAVAASQAPAR
jgi:hypothetical protein